MRCEGPGAYARPLTVEFHWERRKTNCRNLSDIYFQVMNLRHEMPINFGWRDLFAGLDKRGSTPTQNLSRRVVQLRFIGKPQTLAIRRDGARLMDAGLIVVPRCLQRRRRRRRAEQPAAANGGGQDCDGGKISHGQDYSPASPAAKTRTCERSKDRKPSGSRSIAICPVPGSKRNSLCGATTASKNLRAPGVTRSAGPSMTITGTLN